jgi:predicted DNA-binding protein
VLKKKVDVLQIRLEPELLERFKLLSADYGVPVSQMLRHHMLQICDSYDEKKRRHEEFLQRQSEKKHG